jgi:predicted acylesterase/phospholipase RssA
VDAGEWLFHEGDPADSLFVVVGGRLKVLLDSPEGPRVVRELGPGAALGELALLTGAPRSASARAVRDSTVLELPDEAFMEAMTRDVGFAAAVARELARQLQASGGLELPETRPALIAIRALGPEVPLRRFAGSLAGALSPWGPVAILDRSELDLASARQAVDEAERRHAHVLLVDDGGSRAWSDLCARQSDRLLLVADEQAPAPSRAFPEAELVLLGPFDGRVLVQCLAAVAPRAHYRLASTEPDDPGIGRLARRLIGRALGVVLSGGGARGFAHIGVLQVLEEEGITVDRLGGCSMGSLVAAMAAAGWSAEVIRDRCDEELVRRSPFNDYTLPRVALIRSRKAARMLERLFHELRIEELAKPLYTVSADLISSSLVVHTRGSVLEAVGASMSIPGLAPPLPRDGRLLVDGGVLDNLPVDPMAETGEGPILAVDVIRRMEPSGAETPSLPSITETLARATVLGSAQRAERNRRLALLVLAPDVRNVALRDFSALDRAVEAGREEATRVLEDGGGDLLRRAMEAPVA